jgi:hypothetical protein
MFLWLSDWRSNRHLPACSVHPKKRLKRNLAGLPAFFDVRIVRFTIARRNSRARHVCVPTILMDQVLWPDEKIAGLLCHRWPIETCFHDLKTTMRISALRCKTAEGVKKELVVYLPFASLPG